MVAYEKFILLDHPEVADKICSLRIRTAYNYWLSICNGRQFPSRQDINPVDIPNLLPYVFLVNVPENQQEMNIRLLGSAIVDFLGHDPTGKLLQEHLHDDNSIQLLDGYHQVLENRCGHYLENSLFTGCSETIRYNRLLCPLSSDNQNIDCIFGAVSFERIHPPES